MIECHYDIIISLWYQVTDNLFAEQRPIYNRLDWLSFAMLCRRKKKQRGHRVPLLIFSPFFALINLHSKTKKNLALSFGTPCFLTPPFRDHSPCRPFYLNSSPPTLFLRTLLLLIISSIPPPPRLTFYLLNNIMSKLYTSSDNNYILTHHTLDAELVADPHDAMDDHHFHFSNTLHSLFTSFDQSASAAMAPTPSIDSLFSSRSIPAPHHHHYHHHFDHDQDPGASSGTESVSSNDSTSTIVKSKKNKASPSSSLSPLAMPSHVVASQPTAHRKETSSSSSSSAAAAIAASTGAQQRDASASSKSRRRHKKSRQIL